MLQYIRQKFKMKNGDAFSLQQSVILVWKERMFRGLYMKITAGERLAYHYPNTISNAIEKRVHGCAHTTQEILRIICISLENNGVFNKMRSSQSEMKSSL